MQQNNKKLKYIVAKTGKQKTQQPTGKLCGR
jgi:hypothetical protein